MTAQVTDCLGLRERPRVVAREIGWACPCKGYGLDLFINQPELFINQPELCINWLELFIDWPELFLNQPELFINLPELFNPAGTIFSSAGTISKLDHALVQTISKLARSYDLAGCIYNIASRAPKFKMCTPRVHAREACFTTYF